MGRGTGLAQIAEPRLRVGSGGPKWDGDGWRFGSFGREEFEDLFVDLRCSSYFFGMLL